MKRGFARPKLRDLEEFGVCLLALGSHENFYRDLQKHKKSR